MLITLHLPRKYAVWSYILIISDWQWNVLLFLSYFWGFRVSKSNKSNYFYMFTRYIHSEQCAVSGSVSRVFEIIQSIIVNCFYLTLKPCQQKHSYDNTLRHPSRITRTEPTAGTHSSFPRLSFTILLWFPGLKPDRYKWKCQQRSNYPTLGGG